MRNFISIFTILALVITTTMPVASHAMMSHDGGAQTVEKAVETESAAAKDHDCPGHGEAKADTQKTAQNDKAPPDKCCDKGMCKCVGGTCHNGLSKIFGNGSNSLAAVSSGSLVFGFDNQFVASALPNRLKRPPKA
jgi:hypothetical protein